MLDLIAAAATALGVVFVAELGDNTQLLALGIGTRYSLRTVAIGLTLGYAAAGAVAALVGGILGAALPQRPVAIVGGVVFLVFAIVAVRSAAGHDENDDNPDDDDETEGSVVSIGSAVATVALTIAIGEMGDKTQLATATLAAQANPVATWVGATIGAASAGMIGAFAGRRLGTRLDRQAMRYLSAALFAVFGVLLLTSAF
jgi:putative Ca2+/H+ antiporter (TMEM165/GDT1 family)